METGLPVRFIGEFKKSCQNIQVVPSVEDEKHAFKHLFWKRSLPDYQVAGRGAVECILVCFDGRL